MNQATLNDAFKFILKNRGLSTFIDWTNEEIWIDLKRHFDERTLLVSRDSDNVIKGIILFDIYSDTNTLHINHILCLDKDSFKAFLESYKVNYNGYNITAFRKGESVRYSNTVKLINKLIYKLNFYV